MLSEEGGLGVLQLRNENVIVISSRAPQDDLFHHVSTRRLISSCAPTGRLISSHIHKTINLLRNVKLSKDLTELFKVGISLKKLIKV